jgi:hypothetical protein
VRQDWEFIAENSHFLGHPELDESTIQDVTCPAVPDGAERFVCTARVTPKSGGQRDVPVVVSLSEAGVIAGWDFEH